MTISLDRMVAFKSFAADVVVGFGAETVCLFVCKSWKSKLKPVWPILLLGFVFLYI